MDRHHMRSIGSERRIRHGRNADIHVGLWREIAVLRRIEGSLEIVRVRPDMDVPQQIAAALAERRKGRQSG